MINFDAKASRLHEEVLFAEIQNDPRYEEHEVARAIVHTRQDLVLLVAHIRGPLPNQKPPTSSKLARGGSKLGGSENLPEYWTLNLNDTAPCWMAAAWFVKHLFFEP